MSIDNTADFKIVKGSMDETSVDSHSTSTASPSIPAMTPQQRAFASDRGSLNTYRQVMVGEAGWGSFIAFEFYRLLLANMESILGIALRRLVLPVFLKRAGRGLVVGHGVTFRQPGKITVGKKVIIDDYALVDVRTKPDANTQPPTHAGGGKSTPEVSIGDFVYIGRQSIISAKYGKISLGAGVNIGSASRIATQGSIEIGESVLISSYVYIGGGNHGSEQLDVPIMEQEMELKGGVSIGKDTWIGTKATIVDGVKIGSGVIVGAHSLVREDVPDNAIVAGAPAKIIRYRA